jgi:hypothetical protein
MLNAAMDGRLTQSKFLAGISEHDQQLILGVAGQRSVAAKEIILRGGDTATSLFLLVEGRARYYHITAKGEELLLLWVTPGDVFGLGTLLRIRPRILARLRLSRVASCSYGSIQSFAGYPVFTHSCQKTPCASPWAIWQLMSIAMPGLLQDLQSSGWPKLSCGLDTALVERIQRESTSTLPTSNSEALQMSEFSPRAAYLVGGNDRARSQKNGAGYAFTPPSTSSTSSCFRTQSSPTTADKSLHCAGARNSTAARATSLMFALPLISRRNSTGIISFNDVPANFRRA